MAVESGEFLFREGEKPRQEKILSDQIESIGYPHISQLQALLPWNVKCCYVNNYFLIIINI